MLNIDWGVEDYIYERHTAKNDVDFVEAKLRGKISKRPKCP